MNAVAATLNFALGRNLPIIRQTEISECGLASLAMIAGFYGFKTDLTVLRRQFPITPRGLTLKDIAEVGSKIGFSTRALRVGIKNVGQLRAPAILHWNMNHFVVLKSVSRKRVTIHDPARGAVVMSHAQFADHFTGVALELVPTANLQRKDERHKLPMSHMWSQMSGLSSTLIQIIIFSIIMQVFLIASPQYLQVVIDKVLPAQDFDLLLVLAIGFALLLAMNIVASTLRSLVVLYAGTTLAYQMSSNLFYRLIRLPLPYFEARHMGDVISRFESLRPVQDFLINGLVKTFIDGLMAFITLALMFVYSPLLAVVVVVALLLYLGLRLIFFSRMRMMSEEVIFAGAAENSNFIETLRGILPIKAFADESNRQLKWQNLFAETLNSSVRLERLGIGFEQAESLIFELERIIVLFLAARLVMDGDFTVGMIFAFTAYRGQFVDAASSLVDLVIDFRMLQLHLDRLADIVMTEPEPTDGLKQDLKEGRIEVKQLSYAYGTEQSLVLNDVSFVIEPGTSIALIGQSGGGKTTLLKLLMGLMRPTGGEIRIDGTNLLQLERSHFRRQVASVMQDDQLFSGSIADNISFYDLNLDYNKIHLAAEQAQIHDEIMQMPMGYDTLVGDMGASLSGGQIQRVLLARALYREPKILFIDEGTSNLDVDTELRVNEAISRLGITRIISAHRKETIESTDRQLLVQDGTTSEVYGER